MTLNITYWQLDDYHCANYISFAGISFSTFDKPYVFSNETRQQFLNQGMQFFSVWDSDGDHPGYYCDDNGGSWLSAF